MDADSQSRGHAQKIGSRLSLVVNKVDNFDKYMADVYEFYNLGIGDRFRSAASDWDL